MNKLSDSETIVCPVCDVTSEITRVDNIRINDTPLLLHDDVGEIYLCMNPDCREYLEKVNDEFKVIKKIELIRRQKEITDLLATEAEITKARLFPRLAEIEAGKILSRVLYHLTSETMHHRAYSVAEVLEACKAIGFNPGDVDNRRISFVLTWLRDYKD